MLPNFTKCNIDESIYFSKINSVEHEIVTTEKLNDLQVIVDSKFPTNEHKSIHQAFNTASRMTTTRTVQFLDFLALYYRKGQNSGLSNL